MWLITYEYYGKPTIDYMFHTMTPAKKHKKTVVTSYCLDDWLEDINKDGLGAVITFAIKL